MKYAGIVLLIAYLIGPRFWYYGPEYEGGLLYYANQIPWYMIVMKYGIVGFFAIVALFFKVEKEKWAIIAAFWIILGFILGSIWWSQRTLDFMYPALAVVSGFGLIKLVDFMKLKMIKRVFISMFLLAIVCMGATSYGFTVYRFAVEDLRGIDTNTVEAINWMHNNVDPNSSIVVTDSYYIHRAFQSFSARKIISLNDFNQNMSSGGYLNYLKEKDIHFIYAPMNEIKRNAGLNIVPANVAEEPLPVLGITELGAKGYSINSLQNQKTCDWLPRDIRPLNKADTKSAALSVDQKVSTGWVTKSMNSGLILDVGEGKIICDVRIAWYNGDKVSYDFIISTSIDGVLYRDLFHGYSTGKSVIMTPFDIKDRVGRYIKVNITNVGDTAPRIIKIL